MTEGAKPFTLDDRLAEIAKGLEVEGWHSDHIEAISRARTLLATVDRQAEALRELGDALEGITSRDGVERRHEICHYHDHLEACPICSALARLRTLQGEP